MTIRGIAFRLILAAFSIMAGARTSFAETPVIALSNDSPVAEVAAYSEYLLDRGGALSYEDIAGKALPFTRHARNSFQFSFKKATLWFRCRIAPAAAGGSEQLLAFDNAALGSVTAYVPVMGNGGAGIRVFRGGWQQAGKSDETPFFVPTFALPMNIDPSRPLVVRVSTPYALQFRATLYTDHAFHENGFILFLFIGFFAGILIAMLLYNMVLYVFVRDRHYIFYILYIFFLLIWQCLLFGLFHYFWPGPGVVLISFITVFSGLMMLFAIVFAIVFLRTARTAPRHDIILKGMAAVMGLIVFLVFLRQLWISNVLAYVAGQAGSVLVFTSGISSLRSGYKPARYYLAAVALFLLASIIFIFRFYGVLPNNPLTMHIMLFGSAAEAVLLSLALGYRIRMMAEQEHILKEREKSLQTISVTDELTGLFNRRFLNASLEKKIAAARRGNTDLSVLMLDVDHFKDFNDTYGHQEGDLVLSTLGKVVTYALREEDIACRYGGEEFVVILHNADMNAALDVAERIRANFESVPFRPGTKHDLHVTVSIGAITVEPDETPERIILRADRAMYRAKQFGRNRVCND